jgi:hypothetical protein
MKIHAITAFLLIILLKTALPDVTPFFVIDSLSGRAEIQRESCFEWHLVSAGEKIYNNDQLRLQPSSHIRLTCSSNAIVFVNQNSHFKVNLLKSGKSLISHFTLISGTAFFNITNTSSQKTGNTLFIHTPSIKASPRDCSFLISLLPDKSTEIRLLQGTLSISKIKDGSDHYLSSPYKTIFGFNNYSFLQSALLQQDIDSLKCLVPAATIDRIMKKQLINWRRDFHVINNKLDDKCLIAILKNKSEYKGNWNIEKNISRFLAWKLNSGSIKIGSELLDSTYTNPLEIAISKKASYLLTGEISSFDLLQYAKITTQADEYYESRIARVKLDISLTETQSGKIIMKESFTGEISQKRKNENSWESLQLLPFDLQNTSFSSTILGIAITQAVDQAVEALLPVLENR